MSFKERVVNEFNRSPIGFITMVFGSLTASASLFLAYLQFAGMPVATISGAGALPVSSLRPSNLLLVMSFFLACSVTLASLINVLDRSYPFQAMILSIPAAVLTGFLSLLMFQLVPPRPFTDQTMAHAKDMAFWATLFVFLAINGRTAAIGIVNTTPSAKKSGSDGDTSASKDEQSGGEIFILLFALLIWGSIVSTGMSKMVQLFLT